MYIYICVCVRVCFYDPGMSTRDIAGFMICSRASGTLQIYKLLCWVAGVVLRAIAPDFKDSLLQILFRLFLWHWLLTENWKLWPLHTAASPQGRQTLGMHCSAFPYGFSGGFKGSYQTPGVVRSALLVKGKNESNIIISSLVCAWNYKLRSACSPLWTSVSDFAWAVGDRCRRPLFFTLSKDIFWTQQNIPRRFYFGWLLIKLSINMY